MRIEKLKAHPSGRIPLREVSGLTVVTGPDGQHVLVAVGDRSGVVARAVVDEPAEGWSWETRDLDVRLGAVPHGRAQLEAVAADGAGNVLLVQEWPNRAEYIAVQQARVAAEVTLLMPDSSGQAGLDALRESWLDPAGSHTEGVVLLRDEHLLVVKEKDPAALVEFGPAGQAPGGFGSHRWLEPGRAWLTRTGPVELTALAAWYPKGKLSRRCPDLSDAEPGATHLVLLSDQGSSVAVVAGQDPAAEPFDGRFGAEVVIRVKRLPDKPEGIALLPSGDVLIACDLHSDRKDNLFVVPRSDWEPLR